MKNKIFAAFRTLVFLVLIAKVLNWFLDFSDQANQLLNITMFTLIGIACQLTPMLIARFSKERAWPRQNDEAKLFLINHHLNVTHPSGKLLPNSRIAFVSQRSFRSVNYLNESVLLGNPDATH